MAEYLERESILNAIRKTSDLYVDQQGLYLSCELIAAMPAAEVQPVKHGKWLHDRRTQWKCSKCGNFLDFDGLNCGRGTAFYCPNCGARMDGENNV